MRSCVQASKKPPKSKQARWISIPWRIGRCARLTGDRGHPCSCALVKKAAKSFVPFSMHGTATYAKTSISDQLAGSKPDTVIGTAFFVLPLREKMEKLREKKAKTRSRESVDVGKERNRRDETERD